MEKFLEWTKTSFDNVEFGKLVRFAKHYDELNDNEKQPFVSGLESEIKENLIILDMNGILISRQFVGNKLEKDIAQFEKFEEASRVGSFLVWKRPHLDNFLDFIFKHFHVAVWSSISSYNLKLFAKHVFGDRMKDLLFMMDNTYCVKSKHPETDEKPLFSKPLQTVWDKYDMFSSQNTVILDDTKLKMSCNPEGTYVCPPEWSHLDENDDNFMSYGKLMNWAKHAVIIDTTLNEFNLNQTFV